MRLQGKVCVITGAGSGIGQAMALRFAREGGSILAADQSGDTAEATAQLVRDAGGDAVGLQVDVRSGTQVQAMVAAAVERWGRLDVLCNNAGILGHSGEIVDVDEAAWDTAMAVNVKGVYLGCKYAIPEMLRSGGGAIVNTASVAGMVGIPQRALYCTSKGAVIALTKQVAVAYVEQGIRCNCVCPGTIDSPWVGRLLAAADDPQAMRAQLEARQPMGRLGTSEEVAAAALYLASDEAAFVTGASLVIDGGWVAR
jgi:NAD(P)-dependent dehydrogenase (short-subunit alcohol dehydrogenase family)